MVLNLVFELLAEAHPVFIELDQEVLCILSQYFHRLDHQPHVVAVLYFKAHFRAN